MPFKLTRPKPFSSLAESPKQPAVPRLLLKSAKRRQQRGRMTRVSSKRKGPIDGVTWEVFTAPTTLHPYVPTSSSSIPLCSGHLVHSISFIQVFSESFFGCGSRYFSGSLSSLFFCPSEAPKGLKRSDIPAGI
uniref:Uncharacterized protein n=1 Tax=Solanum lycopersicum TaxID=4081 RepID=A0A3Q7H895_SOLLC